MSLPLSFLPYGFEESLPLVEVLTIFPSSLTGEVSQSGVLKEPEFKKRQTEPDP